MSPQSGREQLERLLGIIIKEREFAKALNIEDMMEATREKEILFKSIDKNDLGPEDKELAETIRFENRRNAYLFWTALNWIRQTMEFFGRQVRPTAYSAGGILVTVQTTNGRLFSGRI